MTEIDFAYFNYCHGGLAGGEDHLYSSGRGYDFAGLARVAGDQGRWPHILLMGFSDRRADCSAIDLRFRVADTSVTLDGCTRDVWSEHALGTRVRACAVEALRHVTAVPGAPAGPLDDRALSWVATRIRPDRVSCSPGTPGWPGAGRYRSGLQAARSGVTVVASTGLRHPAREEI